MFHIGIIIYPISAVSLRDCYDVLLSVITWIAFLNVSLDSSTVPTKFKEAVLTPIIKKDFLDHKLYMYVSFRPMKVIWICDCIFSFLVCSVKTVGSYSFSTPPSVVKKSDNITSTVWVTACPKFVFCIFIYSTRLSSGVQSRFLSWKGKNQNQRFVLCHQFLPFLFVVKKSRYCDKNYTCH